MVLVALHDASPTLTFPDTIDADSTWPKHNWRITKSVHHSTLYPNLTSSAIQYDFNLALQIVLDVFGCGGGRFRRSVRRGSSEWDPGKVYE
jgi:hypothetical protein